MHQGETSLVASGCGRDIISCLEVLSLLQQWTIACIHSWTCLGKSFQLFSSWNSKTFVNGTFSWYRLVDDIAEPMYQILSLYLLQCIWDRLSSLTLPPVLNLVTLFRHAAHIHELGVPCGGWTPRAIWHGKGLLRRGRVISFTYSNTSRTTTRGSSLSKAL